jgi:hypothetical protein
MAPFEPALQGSQRVQTRAVEINNQQSFTGVEGLR